MSIIEHVNILQGTDNSYDYSNGNTLPLCALPFGMTHWTLENRDDPLMFFSPRLKTLHAIRATHQPSPWIGDYGALRILPQTGPRLTGRAERFSAYDPQRMVAGPDYLRVRFERYRVDVELTPTLRGALLRCAFPASCPKRLIMDFLNPKFRVWMDADGQGLAGHSLHHSGGVPATYAFYYAVRLNVRLADTGPAPEGCYLELPEDVDQVEVRIGTSFISAEQARLNLDRELGTQPFESVREAARTEWETRLNRFQIEADQAQKATFYSCLYRTQLFPRIFHELDERGDMIHYSPYDGQIHAGPMYADNGFWDTHRTVYPLFSLMLGKELETMLEGWTNAAKEGGWFPRWSSPGYRACMIGTHADAIIADAVVKGITGFDVRAAYTAMLRNAYEPGHAASLYGRMGLQDYIDKGYLPTERYPHAVSRTLDYAYNDFCVAQVAAHLGDEPVRQELLQRSSNYQHCFNPATGFMQGRTATGEWVSDFSPIRWGGDYVEGSAWQCSWAVPHDPEGLMALHGGRDVLAQRIAQMVQMPPIFEVGAYQREIHEMAEMALADLGQYAHSNQPSHHILWLWAQAGNPEAVHHWISKVVSEYYSADIDGFAGDEDNGEMSAWYIFATLGFYPLCPGKPEYVRTRPQVDEARVLLASGHELVIRPPEQAPVSADIVQHHDLMQGGEHLW